MNRFSNDFFSNQVIRPCGDWDALKKMSVKLSFNEPESSYENIAFLPTHIQNRRVQNLNQIGRISIPNFIYHENKTQHFIHRRKKKQNFTHHRKNTEFYLLRKKHTKIISIYWDFKKCRYKFNIHWKSFQIASNSIKYRQIPLKPWISLILVKCTEFFPEFKIHSISPIRILTSHLRYPNLGY